MEEINKRREFIRMAVSAAGLSLCGCSLSLLSGCDLEYIEEKYPIVYNRIRVHSINILEIPELMAKDGIVSRSFGKVLSGRQVIVLRKDVGTDDDFIVFSSICPHGGGEILPPDKPSSNYHCTEHYSEYEFYTGKTLKPPDSEPEFDVPLIRLRNEFDSTLQTLNVYW